MMLVHVKWGNSLEPVYCQETDNVRQLRERVASAPEVLQEHKQLVHKGLLLQDDMTLITAGLIDDATVHVVPNDQPFKGKTMLIKSCTGVTRTLYVTEHFRIEDLKEDLYCFPREPPPESQVLIFAGKQLENERTIREYNIQKGSCLQAVTAATAKSDIRAFIRSTVPSTNALHVSLDTKIVIQLSSIEEDESQYWGHLLGSPDITTLLPEQLQVRAKGSKHIVTGDMTIDFWARKVTFKPDTPLQPAAHYIVILNKSVRDYGSGTSETAGLVHSKSDKVVEGLYRWSFFTEGYKPLRVASVYPPPQATVAASTCRIVVTFNEPLHKDCVEMGARDWVRVRGSVNNHTMLDPYYDHKSKSLVFESSRAFVPGDVVRVKLLGGLVVGERDQTMMPMQADFICRSNPFSWKFYVAEQPSTYEAAIQRAFGCKSILARMAAHVDNRSGVVPTVKPIGVTPKSAGVVPTPLLASQLPIALQRNGTPRKDKARRWTTSDITAGPEGGLGSSSASAWAALRQRHEDERREVDSPFEMAKRGLMGLLRGFDSSSSGGGDKRMEATAEAEERKLMSLHASEQRARKERHVSTEGTHAAPPASPRTHLLLRHFQSDVSALVARSHDRDAESARGDGTPPRARAHTNTATPPHGTSHGISKGTPRTAGETPLVGGNPLGGTPLGGNPLGGTPPLWGWGAATELLGGVGTFGSVASAQDKRHSMRSSAEAHSYSPAHSRTHVQSSSPKWASDSCGSMRPASARGVKEAARNGPRSSSALNGHDGFLDGHVTSHADFLETPAERQHRLRIGAAENADEDADSVAAATHAKLLNSRGSERGRRERLRDPGVGGAGGGREGLRERQAKLLMECGLSAQSIKDALGILE